MNRRSFLALAAVALPVLPATPAAGLTIEDAMEGVLADVMRRLDAAELASSRPWAASSCEALR